MTGSFDPEPHNSSSQVALGGVLFLSLVIRVAVVAGTPGALHQDTDAYRVLAETLHNSLVFGFGNQGIQPPGPTAYRPPLYPVLLSTLVVGRSLSLTAVAILHVVLGMLTTFCVWRIGVLWGLGRFSLAAALMTACDPILLHQSTQLMTETLAAAFTSLALWGLSVQLRTGRVAWSLISGLLLGMASLCRPTFLPWLIVVCLIQAIADLGTRAAWRRSAAMWVGAVLVLFPWAARNWWHFGEWKVTTTHGGYTFLLANNSSFYRYLREGERDSVWDSRQLDTAWLRRQELRDSHDDLWRLAAPNGSEFAPRGAVKIARTEFEDDQLAYDLAWRFIRKEPAMFAYACFYRAVSFWHVLPHRTQEAESTVRRAVRYLIATWYVGFSIACGIGIWKLKGDLLRRPWLWGILLCLSFTVLHAVYWSNMRMRAPLIPFLSLLAAAALKKAPDREFVTVDKTEAKRERSPVS